ncbi:MAG: sulfatase [Verrucomicrobiota bacterium]
MKILSVFLALSSLSWASPPNILFIAIDDLRTELNCYGATHIHSPHIDQLSKSGRQFNRHYVSVPICAASRYAMLTGLRPTHLTDDNRAFDKMPTVQKIDPESWVELLRRNGWKTVCIGKVSHESDGFQWSPASSDGARERVLNPDMNFSWDEIAFDHSKWGAQTNPVLAYSDGTARERLVSASFEVGTDDSANSISDQDLPDGGIAEAAIEKLKEFKDDNTRFCLAVGFLKPHLPFNAPRQYFDLYDKNFLPSPNPTQRPVGAQQGSIVEGEEITLYTQNSNLKDLKWAYSACVSYIDAQVGKITSALDELDLSKNTVVLLWSDHGWMIGDYGLRGKQTLLERSLLTPLIVRLPEQVDGFYLPGSPTDALVESLDIYPTIAEICGLEIPSNIAGESLVPLLKNPFLKGKPYTYSRFSTYHTVRTKNHRLINGFGISDTYILSSPGEFETNDVSSQFPQLTSELTAQLLIQPLGSSQSFAAWSEQNEITGGLWGDDDLDGQNNFSEYGLNSDPNDASSRGVLDLQSKTDHNFDPLTLSMSLNRLARDFPLDIGKSKDLENWEPIRPVSLDFNELNDQLSIEFLPGSQKEFYQIRISQK